MSNTFDINILVNGSRCKQYQHENKTFIQANPGSEYVIEIRNNYWKRIEMVGSVDGLDILNGKTATDTNTGYVIDAYHSEKIKGFRLSDDEVASFRFGHKFNGKTYAQSKQDGSEKNCGVVGLRLYYEYEPCATYTITTNAPPWPIKWDILGGGTGIPNPSVYTTNVQYGCSTGATSSSYSCGGQPNITTQWANSNILRSSAQESPTNLCFMSNASDGMQGKITCNSLGIDSQPRGFDMGTEFGRRESSKVTNVQFTRGYLAHSFDIYYASREALIEMGVPITNQLKVNLPESFPGKYAQPPKNWVG